jgi:hypothetical protein
MKYNYLEQYNLIQILQEAGIGTSSNLSKDIIFDKLKNYKKIQLPELEINYDEIKMLIYKIFVALSDYLESIEKSIKDAKSGERSSDDPIPSSSDKSNDTNIEKLEKAYDDLFLYVYGKDKPETRILENFKQNNFVKDIYENNILPKIKNLERFPSIKKAKEIKSDFEKLINGIEMIPKNENEKKDLIKKNFDLFKNNNGFFGLNQKIIKNKIHYWFFHEKKLYLLRLSIIENIKDNKDGADFSFYVSNDFYDKPIEYFIENYMDFSNFTLDKQVLNDSAGFWLKIGAIIKTFSDDYKINYFKFSGADHDLKEKSNRKTLQTVTENSFKICNMYLRANLIKNEKNENINNSLLDLINQYLEQNKNDLNKKIAQLKLDKELKALSSTLLSLQKIEDNINKDFKTICKKFKFNPPKDKED